MEPFEYTANPGRVVFGSGALQKLPDEIRRLKLKSPLLLSTPQQVSQASELATILTSAGITPAGTYTKATMHTPTNITTEAIDFLKSHSADCIVSIGGGSTTGLGKALSIRITLPHICIPTTYAGSEMTPILGETDSGKKTTRTDPLILPCTVIYDVSLTMTLPTSLSATSGVNAIAHAVEALYSIKRNPIISLLALEGIRSLATSLPTIIKSPQDQTARSLAQYGAYLCGVCLGSSSMSLHHKLCHTLGGSFNLPHAETHTIVLPHALAYNAPNVPEVMERLAEVLPESRGDAIHGLNVLLEKLKVKRALREYGMQEGDVGRAAELACQTQYPNPRELDEGKLREVIRRCWAGEEARVDL